MLYNIKNEDLAVTVSTLGAELQSVCFHGEEKLWQNENGGWNGHAPILFPVAGHCGVTVDGISYPIPAHGFAPTSEFSVTSVGNSEITLALTDSEATRKCFPFVFKFSVIYAVEKNSLSITYRIENPSDKALYTFAGGHESFVLREPLGTHTLVFSETEHFLHHFHDAGGYMTGETKDFGKGTRFPIPPEYLQNGDTLIFPSICSDHVTLVDRSGEEIVDVSFPGYKNLLLWRPDGANMICIEPWMNLPDPAGAKDIPFSEKPNVIRIDPYNELVLPRKITYYK